jgi:hypothetical protein
MKGSASAGASGSSAGQSKTQTPASGKTDDKAKTSK